ncbi:MAG: hypothetical protein KatS3mg117_1814 [Geminicoccaceae bacterium]|jgi:hypothetical protein|nr:MAG: hypothetical protein KatS3mg117_1814 [Geminicoccaceae bacterium]
MRTAGGAGGSEAWAEDGRTNRARPPPLSRHALRTPLSAIRGTAELLLAGVGGPLGATARDLLAAAGEAALRLERLVEPLLAVAERAGGPAPWLQPVEPAPFLRRLGVELAIPQPSTRARGRSGRQGAPPGPVRVRVLAEPVAFRELVALVAGILGPPLAVEAQAGACTGAVLLRFRGGAVAACSEDERPLLVGLARRLARLTGGRLLARREGEVGLVLRPAESRRRASQGAEGGREGSRRSAGPEAVRQGGDTSTRPARANPFACRDGGGTLEISASPATSKVFRTSRWSAEVDRPPTARGTRPRGEAGVPRAAAGPGERARRDRTIDGLPVDEDRTGPRT